MMIDLTRAEAEQALAALRPAEGCDRHDLDYRVTEAVADRIATRLADPDPEPLFVIKARDLVGPMAIAAYRAACAHAGLDHQRFEVSKALVEHANWQERHPTRCHLPNHDHQPANT